MTFLYWLSETETPLLVIQFPSPWHHQMKFQVSTKSCTCRYSSLPFVNISSHWNLVHSNFSFFLIFVIEWFLQLIQSISINFSLEQLKCWNEYFAGFELQKSFFIMKSIRRFISLQFPNPLFEWLIILWQKSCCCIKTDSWIRTMRWWLKERWDRHTENTPLHQFVSTIFLSWRIPDFWNIKGYME